VLDAAVAGTISEAESRILALNRGPQPALAPLARLLLRTESIASSKVEGIQIDARTLARAEAKRETGARIGSEAVEILANVDAMQLAVEEAAAVEVFAPDDMLAIHRALLASTRPAIAGTLRNGQNWIGGNDYNPCDAVFVPPPPEEVRGLFADLARFCNDEGLPPLLQAAIAHAQFETIHPFADGNGRIGRALIQVLLRRRGLAENYVPPISVILAAEREAYIAGLTDFRSGREQSWFERFSVAAARAADLASEYLVRVAGLQDAWRERLRGASNPRGHAAAWAIIGVLPAHPVLTGGITVVATGRSRPAVDQGIQQLVDAGVLEPLTEGSRNRSWEAVGLLDLVAGLEEAEPPS
jgi:Fic family protein